VNLRRISLLPLLIILLVTFSTMTAHAQTTPVVHAVLFYSPACGHCHYVISETLPPLFEKYGEQLQIIGVDVTQPQGQELFLAALQKFGLESEGVPFLVIDNLYLVGSLDIPEKFPGLIETYLAQGGIDWPDIPGLQDILSVESEKATEPTANQSVTVHGPPEPATVSPSPASRTGSPGLHPAESERPGWLDRFANDPSGNTLAVLVLAGMLAALVWVAAFFPKMPGASLKDSWARSIPLLCALGLVVAGYLAYVETTQVTAVCGPVGDCNTVQQSEYARLFGILPIGVLGLFGYVAIILAWLVTQYANDHLADLAVISLFIMTAIGTIFSIYLTFLEPFVIGATCAWCLTSAIIMTILMLLTVSPAKAAFSEFTKMRPSPP
jgi:uncharacterized membrane protein